MSAQTSILVDLAVPPSMVDRGDVECPSRASSPVASSGDVVNLVTSIDSARVSLSQPTPNLGNGLVLLSEARMLKQWKRLVRGLLVNITNQDSILGDLACKRPNIS